MSSEAFGMRSQSQAADVMHSSRLYVCRQSCYDGTLVTKYLAVYALGRRFSRTSAASCAMPSSLSRKGMEAVRSCCDAACCWSADLS